MADSSVERVYLQLKGMAAGYVLRPGERLNEVEIARRLGVSRTPLREALNRLNTEGFLTFLAGKGFYGRELDPKEIFDLYELRKSLEVAAVRLSMARAVDGDIEALQGFLRETGPGPGNRPTEELVALDETFHDRLMAMSGNAQMARVLQNVNDRIRFVRWIDMDVVSRRPASQREHRLILDALRARDEAGCARVLEQHIDRRIDQITAAIGKGFAQIYMRDRSAPAP